MPKLLNIAGVLACAALLLPVPGHAAGPAQEGAPGALAGAAFTLAQARRHDADTLRTLSAEGALLYGRDPLKLDGYQYCSQALALAERGEFRLSIEAAAKALHVGTAKGDDALVASAKRDMAIAYSYAGDTRHAEEMAREAIAQPGADARRVLAPAWKVLGDVYARQGDLAQAAQAYGQSLQFAGKQFAELVRLALVAAYVGAGDTGRAQALFEQLPPPEDSALRQMYLRTQGNLLLAQRQPAQALAVFESAKASAVGLDAAYYRVWALDGQARALQARGEDGAALDVLLEAAALSETVRARFHSEEIKAGLFGEMQQIFDRAVGLAMARGRSELAWELSERGRARALLDAVRGRAGKQAQADTVPLDRVRSQLLPGEALLQYHVLEDRTLAWVVRRDGARGVELPLPRQALADAVKELQDALLHRSRGEVNALAARLGDALVRPLEPGRDEVLVIVPHDALHYLPFHVLRLGERYLAEDHAMSVVPSAAVATQFQRDRAPGAGRLLAFGNPAIDPLHDLPSAASEVGNIVKLFPDHAAYLREQATRERFLAQAGASRVIHVAAHAEADRVDPLESRILFAREGEAPGLLLAREVYGLDLSQVSLVTLSACESGLGRIGRGDEIFGFTRSFLAAGSQALVASLWPVEDRPTQLLMTTFYEALAQGRDAATAMRAGRLAVLRDEASSHPIYWAPFNLIGDWRLRVAGGAKP